MRISSTTKDMVGLLVKQGFKTEQIAKKLKITYNQATHIRAYYFSKNAKVMSPQKRAWITRKAGGNVQTAKPKVIQLKDGTKLEFHIPLGRVIVKDDIIVFCD